MERARHALARIEQALTGPVVEPALDADRLRAALDTPLPESPLEEQRLFALGWLAWLSADHAQALCCFQRGSSPRSAWWLARVRLLQGDTEAVADYEKALRGFQGSPQATAWFVDLLWRSGRHERAGQVWKSLRTNRRILACEEASLLEVRAQLARGQLQEAEKSLRGAGSLGGTLRTERLLLLAWLLLQRHQYQEADSRLEGAAAGPFPFGALQSWRQLAHRGSRPLSWEELGKLPLSPPGRAWIAAQQGRLTGLASAEIAEALKRAGEAAVLGPLIRHAKACLGLDDFEAILSALPGPFLAPRCRLWVTLSRFCRGSATPQELLTVVQQADAAGYSAPGLEEVRSLAEAMSRNLAPEMLWSQGSRNARRAAVELILRQGGGGHVLLSWAREPIEDLSLRQRLGRALLRGLLGDSAGPREDILQAAESLGLSEWTGLLHAVLSSDQSGSVTPVSNQTEAGRLWNAAVGLMGERTSALDRMELSDRGRGLALALEAHAAARRGDRATLRRLLAVPPPWPGLEAGPPSFLCAVLETLPTSGDWPALVAKWLRGWGGEPATPRLRDLWVRLGLLKRDPATAEPPQGVERTSWFLHQASQALAQEDFSGAWGWIERSRATGLGSLDESRRGMIEAATTDLERWADAHWLSRVCCLVEGMVPVASGFLIDFAELLRGHSLGASILRDRELPAARTSLTTLAERGDLSPRLAHHLALVYYRAARHAEENARFEDAGALWLKSWRCWLRWGAGQPEAVALGRVIDHLHQLHRARLEELVSLGDVSRARVFWELVQVQVPALLDQAGEQGAALLRERLQRFRAELATEFLLRTREAMRHGAIPEGWRADYEQGLARLRRLLSLDRDNPQLLIALVEWCADWFLDLYDLPDLGRLKQEVERFTPFALQLARTGGGGVFPAAEELRARGALSEYFKFRAFVSEDPQRKRDLYREALAMNPANDNVRTLLDGLQGDAE